VAETRDRLVAKLVVVGDCGVGKSALIVQLVSSSFVLVYDPTIEDSYIKHIAIDKEPFQLYILDTAGHDMYSMMRPSYMCSGQGFLLVYAVNSRESFEKLEQFHQQILSVKNVGRFPMVLCGNKCDLEDQRQVSTMEGNQMAKDWGVPFFETSALQRANIDESFSDLVREIRRHSVTESVNIPRAIC